MLERWFLARNHWQATMKQQPQRPELLGERLA
jgi:hypothetical protein